MRGTDIAAKGGRRLMGLLEKYKFVLLVRRSWPSTWRVWKKSCPIHSLK